MNTTYFLRKVLTGKRIRDSINVGFDKNKKRKLSKIITLTMYIILSVAACIVGRMVGNSMKPE